MAPMVATKHKDCGVIKACTGAAIRSWKNGCVIRRGPVTPFVELSRFAVTA